MRNVLRGFVLLIALTGLVFTSGCGILFAPIVWLFHKDYVTVPAEYDLTRQLYARVLVVPFKESPGYYNQSQIGKSLARGVQMELKRNIKNVRLADPQKALSSMRAVDLESADWEAVGKKVDADYIVLGEILSFRTRAPKSQNLLSGEIVMTVQLLDVSEGGAMVWMKNISSYFPEGASQRTTGIPTFQMSERALEAKLLSNAARDIVQNFYPRKVKKFEAGREEIY